LLYITCSHIGVRTSTLQSKYSVFAFYTKKNPTSN